MGENKPLIFRRNSDYRLLTFPVAKATPFIAAHPGQWQPGQIHDNGTVTWSSIQQSYQGKHAIQTQGQPDV